ncbi:hypothetical protein ACLOB2_11530 [Levilactobacillus brevis]|uniref:hypothetical protein n=1 Tax=Levilactobacillus brevis TaxID=1580 RepID=UPI003EBAA9D3
MVHILITILIVISFVVGGLGILFSKQVDGSYDRFFLIVGGLFLCLGLGIIYHRASGQHPIFSDTIPSGYKYSDDVARRALHDSGLAVIFKMEEEYPSSWEYDSRAVQVMVNPKTKRYVFNYKVYDKVIPCYVVFQQIGNDTSHADSDYTAYLIPESKKSSIYYIWADEGTVDRQIKATHYEGYSYNDLADICPSHLFNQNDSKKVSYHGYYIFYK